MSIRAIAALLQVLLYSAIAQEQLSWISRIFCYPNFLSDHEVDAVMNATYTTKKYSESVSKSVGVDSDVYLSVYLDSYPRLPPILQEIERKIGAVTGSLPHPHEEPFNVHRIPAARARHASSTPLDAAAADDDRDVEVLRRCIDDYNRRKGQENSSGGDGEDSLYASCGVQISGVHHDKVQKEYSSATVIVYLNDVAIGGGTTFPCYSQYEDSRGGGNISKACGDAFLGGARWFDGNNAVTRERYDKHTVDEGLHNSLSEILMAGHLSCLSQSSKQSESTKSGNNTEREMSSTASASLKGSIVTVAKKGSAVVFFHDKQNLFPDSMTWHGITVTIANIATVVIISIKSILKAAAYHCQVQSGLYKNSKSCLAYTGQTTIDRRPSS